MTIQSEQSLENILIKQLQTQSYELIRLKNIDELKANLKKQLEIHNLEELRNSGNEKLSKSEFEIILHHLEKGNIFAKAHTLRDKFNFTRECTGRTCYLEFFNTEKWCHNQYQVAQQISVEGKYQNRYDVTILINGLPLVQIELKRRGLDLKEAFNQTQRYQKHSYWAKGGLFQYIQLFVISNGVDTKYYANNPKRSYKQTFFWTTNENKRITNLEEFTSIFLEKCHVSKMICKYIVLHQTDKILMVLRPYQYYAVEALVNRVMKSNQNAYIWHTTGSGKTLTSFKTAQILKDFPKVHKVVFCVDRADLDYQTAKEFNSFAPNSIDSTTSTKTLVKQFGNESNKLIVTTIQKLNTAIQKSTYLKEMQNQKDKRIVFIFDECHRSQFGDTHKRIVKFFNRAQLFGFTGTPIFAETAIKNKTTKDLFTKRLHEYLITNAIHDENVLKFSVEYWGRIRRKEGEEVDKAVEKINKEEFYDNPKRLKLISDWIINHHDSKTHQKQFTAMMCVGSVKTLIKYYDILKEKKESGEHNLRIATIFSYGNNEDDETADDQIPEENFDIENMPATHSRDRLEEYVKDYNKMYGTNYSIKDSKGFYDYYKNIAKRIKDREKDSFNENDRVDILLVVNMYLTGFDAKKVNTLYVDKNLKNHGLIQAFSRTNRILGEKKSQGNIVCFRPLKNATDEAIKLFSNKDANEKIIMDPYEIYVDKFNLELEAMRKLTPTVESVNALENEEQELLFVRNFRNLIRLMNQLITFNDFAFSDLNISNQEYEDYKSKYLEIYQKYRDGGDNGEGDGGTSIIDDVDFELELIHKDEINVTYIMNLLKDLHLEKDDEQRIKKKDVLLKTIGNEPRLRSKKELIEKFISLSLPKIENSNTVEKEFKKFWNEEKQGAVDKICYDNNLIVENVNDIISTYLFDGKKPLRDQILKSMKERPKIKERKSIVTKITNKILEYVETFEDDM